MAKDERAAGGQPKKSSRARQKAASAEKAVKAEAAKADRAVQGAKAEAAKDVQAAKDEVVSDAQAVKQAASKAANNAANAVEDAAQAGAEKASKVANAAADAVSGAEEATPSAKKAKEPVNVSRRTLMIGAGSTAALLVLGGLRYAGHNPLVRPPGGTDEKHLVSACIRCEKCYEACPRHVIYPARIEDGLLGMRSPALNFDTNYCDFCAEENDGVPLCVRSCPTRALTLPEGATAHNTILGLATIDSHTCLAFRDTGCHFCYDACNDAGYEAIELSGEGYSPTPHVVADKCVGCGACESVCVSLSAGSIVEGATERAIKVRVLES